jgi:GTP-binding protein
MSEPSPKSQAPSPEPRAPRSLDLVRVAIVGRPNVGKSALFNRMVGRRVAIVHDKPGVTRDRIAAQVERDGRLYEFLDTGGIGLAEEGAAQGIPDAVRFQADLGVSVADVVFFVVDAQEGLVPLDREVADQLRKFSKPVWLLVNKMDHEKHEDLDAEFMALGLEPEFPVSAVHGRGIDPIWNQLREVAAGGMAGPDADLSMGATRLAVVGRPNVGKSTLINRLLGAERVIVSNVPGTTRDAVDIPMQVEGQSYVLIDTAGIRHQRRLDSSVEVFSKMRSEQSIKRCDIAVIVIDPLLGMTRQDKMIAGFVQEQKKPCMIVVNKWDLNEEKVGGRRRRTSSKSEFEANVRREAHFLDYAPILFTSALQGYRAENLWGWISKIDRARRKQIATGPLNRIFTRAAAKLPAPIRGGKRLKIYYVIQRPEASVPTFVLFVNSKRVFDESYGRFLRNSLREEEEYLGCPIIFELREKGREKRPSERKGHGTRRRDSGLSDYL